VPAGLEAYIERLKYARATGGEETKMNTVGLNSFYGIQNYELGKYGTAETDFKLALARDADNPYINYMLAVSMAAQGKTADANTYFQKAMAVDPSLQKRYNTDVAAAKALFQKIENANKPQVSAPAKTVYGGMLVLGEYTCTQTVYNGPGASPAYSPLPKGYFVLKADGTYRYLDNGGTGRYKYDAKTGNVEWLSGYFKDVQAQSTQYQVNKQTVQMTVNFTSSYRWECGCNKK
jgi:tetratricopeptide (TPR) repeat protein